MGDFQRNMFELIAMVIGVAIVAVILSQRANTANVLQAFGTMMAQLLGAATAPVTGGSNNS